MHTYILCMSKYGVNDAGRLVRIWWVRTVDPAYDELGEAEDGTAVGPQVGPLPGRQRCDVIVYNKQRRVEWSEPSVSASLDLLTYT